MAGLSVKFRAVDDISSRFDAMVSAGTRALDTFDRLESAADSSYETVSNGASQAAQAIERAADATDYWTDKIGNYDRGAMQAIYSTEELVEMGYMTEDALHQAGDAIDEAADSVEEFGEQAEEAGRRADEFGEESSGAVMTLDDVLAAAGIAVALKEIAGAFSDASQSAAEFEVSIAKLTTVADTSVLSADQLSAQISQLSMDMAQGVNEITDSAYNAISAGVDTANAVDIVENATMLSVAGFTSVGSSLSVLTTALNAYGLEASEITDISDSLVTSQNLGVLTIDQLSSSMGKAISTASAYSVDLYNLESGYISLTKAGISVEESTTYISSMFNELGKSSSNVAKVLQEETGQSFGQLMESGYSLADVLGIVYESVDRNAEAMMNLWGSAEAGKAANAVINQGLETFNKNLVTLRTSSGTTAKAYETMTNTTAFATQRLENSFANLSIAIGDDINPVVAEMKNEIADVVDGFTGLIQKHPAISAVLTGVAVGLGTVTVAVTAYTAATKLAAIASAALGTSMTVALGPLGLAAAVIGGVTAAVVLMANAEDEAEKAQQALTVSSQEMSDELDRLQDEYDAMVEAGEEDTVAAYQLKNQIDELTDSFAENGRTIGDLIAESETLGAVIDDITGSYDEAVRSIDESESNAKSLIAQLAAMESKADKNGAQLEIMAGIVDRLNESYGGLNLTLDETNGKLNMSISDLWKFVTESAEEDKAEQNMNALMGYLEQYQEAQRIYDEANKTMNAKSEEYDKAVQEAFPKEHPFLAWTGWADGAEMNWSGTAKTAFNEWKQAKDATEAAKKNFEELENGIRGCYEAMGYTKDEIDDLMAELALASATATWGDLMDKMFETSEAASDGYDEAKSAIQSYQDQLQELCEAYDAAYESALGSIQGQYKLWDEVKEVVAMSQSSIEDALQSQLNYWTAYNSNLESLTARASDIEGLSDMLKDLSDGSAESAAMLQGLNNMDDTDLSAVVKQYTDLQAAQEDTAKSVTDLQTDFSDKLETITEDMGKMVDGMELSDEAKTNAKKTMDAYVEEIEAGVARAQSAIDSLSFANSALSNGGFHNYAGTSKTTPAPSGIPSNVVPYMSEYAVGTESAAPGLALVGEEGPELVRFGGGEVVYTADETSNILSRDNSDSILVPPSESDNGKEANNGDKTITLKIEGAGEVKVGGNGVSKEEVVALLLENMKGALMSILQTEIMEEGDMAYDF